MRISRPSTATALAFSFCLLSQAHATIVPGKGGNCAAIWDTGTASASPVGTKFSLTCTDGDPTCDGDGLPNGACQIALTACVGQVSDSCPTPPPITGALKFKSLIGGVPKRNIVLGFVPPAAGTCGSASMSLATKRVPKNPSKPAKSFKPSKKVQLQLKSKGFLNALVVQCVPPGTVSGGKVCAPRTDDPSLPNQITLQVPSTGSDLDNGWTGTSHNFPVIQGSTLKYCLSNCDGTSDTLCDGSGETGDGTLNGPTFGAPLPLLAAGIPVCVVNRYQTSPLTNTFDLATGVGSGDVNLFSDVYLTSNPSEVCPRCNPTVPNADPTQQIGKQGKCSATARAVGSDCTIEGQVNVALGAGQTQYFLSSACIPAASQNQATLDIRLPLTTGQAPPLVGPLPCPDSAGPQTLDDSCGAGTCTEGACTGSACVSGSGTQCIDAKGGISQACCSSNTTSPCFGTKGGGSIIRTGAPIMASGQGAFAATFCIARTASALINASTGLPGPGALILPSQRTVSCGAAPCP
jgi:hypothetical protein